MHVEPGALTLADLRRVWEAWEPITLAEMCWEPVRASARTVDAVVERGDPAYGINTGFGKLAKVRIPNEDLAQLQTNLVRSHAVGVGPLLASEVVRLVCFLKIASLAQGYSGVRAEALESLIALYNAQIWPCIPCQGSVGASGDLAPLAHMTLAVMGEGEVEFRGARMPAGEALAACGLKPYQLGPKEGLAFLNGTQVSTALALDGFFAGENAFCAALLAGTLSVDAAKGSDAPFDARIHRIRGQRGQMDVAEVMSRLMVGSEIRASHLIGDDRVQDPYSLRCQPQVMGACLTALRHGAEVLVAEANAVTDNPLVFPESGSILSGGNFHAEPVALVADYLGIAIAEVGALSERRIALLIDASLSGLPPFLVRDAGLNSGFMILHVTAAALASENKGLAHPASVDSLPTSANQEDHVSMATFAGRKLGQIARNVRQIIGIELLAAVQGVEFHRPLRSSPVLEEVVTAVREISPALGEDRSLAPDLAAILALVDSTQVREWAAVTV